MSSALTQIPCDDCENVHFISLSSSDRAYYDVIVMIWLSTGMEWTWTNQATTVGKHGLIDSGPTISESYKHTFSLQWRHNECNGVSNHRRLDCLLNRLFRRRTKKTSKLRVAGLCVGNSPVTGEFPSPRASNAENVSIWWRHHVISGSEITRPQGCQYWFR